MFGLASESTLKRVESKIDSLLLKLKDFKMSQDTANQALADAIAQNESVEQSAIDLLNGLSAQLQAAIASGDPAKVQAFADQLSADSAKLAAAVAANTPAAPAA